MADFTSCLLTESQSETKPAPRWRLVQDRIHAPLVWHHLSTQSSPGETPARTGTRSSPLLSVQVRIAGFNANHAKRNVCSAPILYGILRLSPFLSPPLLSKKQCAQAVGPARSVVGSVGGEHKAATHITVNGRKRVAQNASLRHHTMKSYHASNHRLRLG